jgi:hypothetical protein
MPDPRPLLAFAPIIGLVAYVAVHLIMARIIRGRGPYPALAIGAAASLVTTVAITARACSSASASTTDTLALVAMNTIASLGFAFGYFNFVNLTIASLRLRMLEEIADGGGRMPRQALMDRYGTAHVIDLRLERLVRGGHLIERNGRLYTGRLQFLAVARIFDMLRGLIFGPTSADVPRGIRQPATSDNRTSP